MEADVLVITHKGGGGHSFRSPDIALGIPRPGAGFIYEFSELCRGDRASCGTPRPPFPYFARSGRVSGEGLMDSLADYCNKGIRLFGEFVRCGHTRFTRK